MAVHRVTRLLPYRPEDLFALVGDVRAYPDFVPWVTSIRVWNERETEPGVTALDAEAQVGFAMIKERFATSETSGGSAHIPQERKSNFLSTSNFARSFWTRSCRRTSTGRPFVSSTASKRGRRPCTARRPRPSHLPEAQGRPSRPQGAPCPAPGLRIAFPGAGSIHPAGRARSEPGLPACPPSRRPGRRRL